MSDAQKSPPKAPRDRSPSFPFIPLKAAVARLEEFEKYFGRHPAKMDKAGLAWQMKEKSSQAAQTLAAMRSFGLIQYQGTGSDRYATLTEDGRKYTRTQQDSVKRQILKQGALRPKIIRKYWTKWGADRPPDAVALDDLHDDGFSDMGATTFLKVYDATIAYAGLSDSDKVELSEDVAGEEPADIGETMKGTPEPAEPSRGVSFVKKARPSVLQPGMLEEVFTLEEGPVTLTFPAELSRESYQDLADHLELLLRKAKRRSEKLFGSKADDQDEAAN